MSVSVMAVSLFMLKINIIVTIFIAVIGSTIICSWWVISKERKISNILEKECDPVRYIEKCNKSNMLYSDLNRAIAYMCLGRLDDGYNLLKNMEMPRKPTKIYELTYHSALMCYYLSVEDLEKASVEYEDEIKKLRKGMLVPSVTFSVDLFVLEYQYKLNRTPETAKYFWEQLKYLYAITSNKLSKRQKLAVRYTEAEVLEELGDIESAVLNYKKVAERGNKLYIAELSRKKLAEIENVNKNK
jgi:uncharacterized protein YggT (Ycf19 family)